MSIRVHSFSFAQFDAKRRIELRALARKATPTKFVFHPYPFMATEKAELNREDAKNAKENEGEALALLVALR
ncbi:MAG: hypothetical protein NZM11_04900 [Anaerolineales bacterium]|nr:hypothetical protein [Anaerolineales bacterium]